MLYRTLNRMIERGNMEGIEEKLDIFFAAGKLTEEEYMLPIRIPLADMENVTSQGLLESQESRRLPLESCCRIMRRESAQRLNRKCRDCLPQKGVLFCRLKLRHR